MKNLSFHKPRLLFSQPFHGDKARQFPNNFGTVRPERFLPNSYLLIHVDFRSDMKQCNSLSVFI